MNITHRSWHWTELEPLFHLPNLSGTFSSSNNEHGENWHGTNTFEEALELYRDGDLKLAKEMEDRANRIEFSGACENDILQSVESVSGGYVDVEQYLIGNPFCMRDFVLNQGKSKIVRILVNRSASVDVKASKIRARGSCLFAIVRALEIKGYSVQLDVGFFNTLWSSENCFEYIVNIKRAGELLDPAIMAFWIAHPAAQRRLMFRLRENLDPTLARAAYGRSCEIVQIPENTIYFPLIVVDQDDSDAFLFSEAAKKCHEAGIEIVKDF